MREDVSEKEKLIGLIVGGISNEFSKDIIKEVAHSIAQKNDIRLAILSGELMERGFMGDDVLQYNAMFNSIYNLGNVCKMDGLIIAMGSLGWLLDGDKAVSKFLEGFSGIPTVLIASDRNDYTTVNYDNKKGISEAIDCLINMYNFNRIGMIGGYAENVDAERRKEIFIECLKENGMEYDEKLYVTSDMSEHSEDAAEKLIKNNPDIQAVFCVNDATAVGLYNVMKKKNLVPGKDIVIFGFDNTRKSTVMSPSLSSVGAESTSLGHKAMELLLHKMDGEEVESAIISTRLFGRESMRYDKYNFSFSDINKSSEDTIDRMFYDCFYRYSEDYVGRENINLKRLFYEILSRMFKGLKNRYLDIDEFNEIGHLIDIFFSNNAMEYTDVHKFLINIERLQNGINKQLLGRENVFINRLFLRMKDDAIKSISELRIKEYYDDMNYRTNLRRYLIKGMDYKGDKQQRLKEHISSMNKLGIDNSAFYMFEKPITQEDLIMNKYPEKILLKGVIKSGDVYLIPEERQLRNLSEIYIQREIKTYNTKFVTFPIFYEKYFYGLLLCDLTEELYEHGELIANITGMLVHMISCS